LPDAKLPLLSAAAPFKEGYKSPDDFVDLAAGTIAIKDVADLYMYANTVVVLRVDGAQLREWLERSATIFATVDLQNPSPQPLLNPHVPSYNFDVIAGVTYQIDITQPPRYKGHGVRDEWAHRIIDLRYRGIPVTADQEFLVVTNNYRADSGGIVPANDPSAIVLRAPDQTRDVIIRYILTEKTVDVQNPPVWSFAPISRPISVTFSSSPAAAKYFAKRHDIVRKSAMPDGYEQFVLNL
jgi:2',3'-cyclic-nucleotide 2'-phosphodiesterase/3'-nucleotidase